VPQFIGVNIHFLNPDDNEMDMLADSGAGLVCTDLSWEVVEQVMGSYDFSVYDRLVSALSQRGIRILFLLGYGNRIYGGDEGWAMHTDQVRAAFARYAAAALERYADQGIIWEIWPEPDQRHSPDFARPSLSDYAALVSEAIPAMRNADPHALIIGPGASHAATSVYEQLGGLGVLPLYDAISVHPYRPEAPETVISDYRRIRTVLTRYSPDRTLPLVVSEWGYARGFWVSYPNLTDEEQAENLVREVLVNLASEVRFTIWYTWSNQTDDPSDPNRNFGVLDSNLHRKPAFYALRTLSHTLDGYRFVARLPAQDSRLYILEFRKVDQYAFAVWMTGASMTLDLPLPCPHAEVVDLMGSKSQVSVNGGLLALPVDRAPQYIVCR
jgi:hypothetical protein